MNRTAINPLAIATTLALAAAALGAAPAARAATSYDNCTYTITALPATLANQGTYCMKGDLATTIGTGNAITVTANNVIIDCNDFKLGGLGAGPTTQTRGIRTTANNLTVRRCNIRGFAAGTELLGTGHIVEDSRFDGNTLVGIYGDGYGHSIRRNFVSNSGGTPLLASAAGISLTGSGDVIDNTVYRVTSPGNDALVAGIAIADNQGGSVKRNRVREISGPGPLSEIYGILVLDNSLAVAIEDNLFYGSYDAGTFGMACGSPAMGIIRDNIVQIFQAGAVVGCTDAGNNFVDVVP